MFYWIVCNDQNYQCIGPGHLSTPQICKLTEMLFTSSGYIFSYKVEQPLLKKCRSGNVFIVIYVFVKKVAIHNVIIALFHDWQISPVGIDMDPYIFLNSHFFKC